MRQKGKANGKVKNGVQPKKTSKAAPNESQWEIGIQIANMRKENGMTQAEVAESLGVSDSTISRIERGECKPKYYLFLSMMQLFNVSREDTIHILIGSDCQRANNLFNELKYHIRDVNIEGLLKTLSEIDKENFTSSKLYHQVYLYGKLLTEQGLDTQAFVDRAVEIIRIIRKDFDLKDISKYHFRLDEIMILNGIGRQYINANKPDEGLRVLGDVAKSMDKFYLNERLKCELYVAVLLNLSTCYGMSGKFLKAEQIAEKGRKLALKYERQRILPFLINNIGEAKFYQDDMEGYFDNAFLAYNNAVATENEYLAEMIKKDAYKRLGIDFSTIRKKYLHLQANQQVE